MKKMIFTLVTLFTLTLSASAMTYEQARNEALFLTDKMAYELNLTDAQYEAAYEINLDYLMGVTSQADVFGTFWERRNMDLSYILYSWQWDAFRAATYFYRPLYFEAGYWHFGIYARYPHRDYFYFGRPHFYATYRGGHAWHLNGGRSYYHGRITHFRPALPAGRSHFGMRNGWDRGDYRGGRYGSSTRITGRHSGGNRTYIDNRGNGSASGYNRNNGNSSNYNRNQGTSGRFGGSNMNSGSANRNYGGSGMNSGSANRNYGGSGMNSGSANRNYSGGSMGSSQRGGTFGGSSSSPTRSMGNSMSGSRSASGHFGGSRSAGGSRSGATTNSHGHFGGNR